MTVQEFVKMLKTGEEPEPEPGTQSKLGDGIYKIGSGQYRVNLHEPAGIDYIVRVEADGRVRIDEQKRP